MEKTVPIAPAVPTQFTMRKENGRWLDIKSNQQVTIQLTGHRFLIEPKGDTTIYLTTGPSRIFPTYRIVFNADTGAIMGVRQLAFHGNPDDEHQYFDTDSLRIPVDHALAKIFRVAMNAPKLEHAE